MTRSKIGFSPVVVTILILLTFSTVLSSATEIAHAGGYVKLPCHLDSTGRICGVFLRPGVRDEYNPPWLESHARHASGCPRWRGPATQIIDRYPDYAILASMSDSIGDFQFDSRSLRRFLTFESTCRRISHSRTLQVDTERPQPLTRSTPSGQTSRTIIPTSLFVFSQKMIRSRLAGTVSRLAASQPRRCPLRHS